MARIYVVSCVNPGNTGGIENFVHNEVILLRGEGHAVNLFISSRSHGNVFRRCVRLLRYFHRNKLTSDDIIHLHDPRVLELSWCTLLFFRHVKIFVSTHGLFFHTKKYRYLKNVYLSVIALLMRGAEGIVCSSGADYEILSRFEGLSLIRFDNPVDTKLVASSQRFRGMKYPKKFIYWGRLSSNKNIDLLLQVFESLISYDSNYSLTIVSRDSDKITPFDWLRLETANSDNELKGLVKSHDAFISLSSYEGFGLAIYEAYSAGLVVYCLDKLPVVSYIKQNIVKFENLDKNYIVERITSVEVNVKAIVDGELRTWQNTGSEFLKLLIDD